MLGSGGRGVPQPPTSTPPRGSTKPGTGADNPLVPQFDFTSCQGVIFVLLMTLFFSGLILAILLPFQYVSLHLRAHGEVG